MRRAILFLHDLGTVQYFDNEFLRGNIVINPQWIVDVMACVVSINSPIQVLLELDLNFSVGGKDLNIGRISFLI